MLEKILALKGQEFQTFPSVINCKDSQSTCSHNCSHWNMGDRLVIQWKPQERVLSREFFPSSLQVSGIFALCACVYVCLCVWVFNMSIRLLYANLTNKSRSRG